MRCLIFCRAIWVMYIKLFACWRSKTYRWKYLSIGIHYANCKWMMIITQSAWEHTTIQTYLYKNGTLPAGQINVAYAQVCLRKERYKNYYRVLVYIYNRTHLTEEKKDKLYNCMLSSQFQKSGQQCCTLGIYIRCHATVHAPYMLFRWGRGIWKSPRKSVGVCLYVCV